MIMGSAMMTQDRAPPHASLRQCAAIISLSPEKTVIMESAMMMQDRAPPHASLRQSVAMES